MNPLEDFLIYFDKEHLRKEDGKLALKVWDVRRFPSAKNYSCWYVSFIDADTYKRKNVNVLCIVLHFDVARDKILRVFFRFMGCVEKGKLKLIGWHGCEDCEYVYFEENEKNIKNAIMDYLRVVRKRFDINDLGKFHDFKPIWNGA
jgi:hypothetical protein